MPNDSIILAYIDLENVAETYRGTPLDFPPLRAMLYGHDADDASSLWTLAAVGLESNGKIPHLTPAETSMTYPWLIESCGWFLAREMVTPQRLAVAFLQLLNFRGIAMIDPDVDVACRGVVEKAQDLTDMIAQSYILTAMYKDLVDWTKHEKSWADTAIQLARDNDCLLESTNSGLRNVALVRDRESSLYFLRQSQGGILIFEEKDIECVSWRGLRIDLCLRECAGLPIALQRLTLQHDYVEEYAVLGWIAHFGDSLHKFEME